MGIDAVSPEPSLFPQHIDLGEQSQTSTFGLAKLVSIDSLLKDFDLFLHLSNSLFWTKRAKNILKNLYISI